MRFTKDAGWVLLGAMLGTVTCLGWVDRQVIDATASLVPMASLAVFGMLVSTLHDSSLPLPGRR